MIEMPSALHAVPGRICLSLPIFGRINKLRAMEAMLEDLAGIRFVQIDPLAESMLIQYDSSSIREQDVLHAISLFCKCLEEVGGEQDENVIQSIMASWLSLESHIEVIAGDKAIMNDYFRMLSLITKQFERVNK